MTFPDPFTDPIPDWHLVGGYYYFTNDIVSLGQALTVENLLEAYRKGIFPWHIDGLPLPWYCPQMRAILDFDDLHIPRSLAKERRRQNLVFTIDEDFESVIRYCSASKRPGQTGTWITADFIRAYCELHRAGFAHSVEARDEAGRIVGGLYGVDAGGVFCGESMFYLRPNASKLALLHIIEYLKGRGSTWLDAQVLTPHLQSLGAKEITRRVFLARLRETQSLGLNLFGVSDNIAKARKAREDSFE